MFATQSTGNGLCTPSRKIVIFLGEGANGIVLTTLFICISHLQLARNPHLWKEKKHQGHQVKFRQSWNLKDQDHTYVHIGMYPYVPV